MASNAYIRIPDSNTTRNESELRSAIDQIHSAYLRLDAIKEKMSQMSNAGADPAALQAEYNLATVQDATDTEALVASTVSELDAAAFFQQLISRLS